MDFLSPEAFFTNLSDVEQRHWEFQATFRDCRAYFRYNKLYPTFARVVDLYHMIDKVLTRRRQFLQRLPPIFALDESLPWKPTLVRVVQEADDVYLARVIELMQLERPYVTKLASEGGRVFDFTQEQIKLSLLPGRVRRGSVGYLMVLRPVAPRWLLYRYSHSVQTVGSEVQHVLGLADLAVAEAGTLVQPVEVRRRAFSLTFPEVDELPTYFADISIEFPFEATILPVLKRMLMAKVAA